MMAATHTAMNVKETLWFPLLSALGIVLFLFFIDEGYYSFRWMLDWGNWIVFVFYLAAFFLIQWIISTMLLRRVHGRQRAWLMFGLVMPVTVLACIWIVS